MNERLLKRIAVHVALAGALAAAAGFALGGVPRAGAALAGAALAVLNLVALRWLLARVVAQGDRTARRVVPLLGLKLVALMGICWVLLRVVGLDALGFLLGASALFVGIVTGSLLGVGPDRVGEEA